jgi:hypothetical protein
LFFGYGFNLLYPCSWCFEFFPPGTPAVFLRQGYAGYVTPCRVLVGVAIASFLPSVRRLEFSLFDGGLGALLQSQWGNNGSLCPVRGRPPSTSRVVDCHLVEEQGFQLLDRRDTILLQGGTV